MMPIQSKDGVSQTMTKVLIDSSGLIGLADKSSRSHTAISSVIDNTVYDIILPSSVIPEASYVIGARLGYRALLSLSEI